MSTATAPASAFTSFRDPSGQLAVLPDRVIRYIRPGAREEFERFLASPFAHRLAAEGKLVSTEQLSRREGEDLAAVFAAPESDALFVEHERIPFRSYPYEWGPAMLAAAALATIEIAEAALDAGFQLKDATPFNILFRGSQPVFVDVLSFSIRDPKEAAWHPYAQFLRTFLYPLAAYKYFGINPEQIFSINREGMEPEELYALAHPLRRISPRFFGLVSLPKWMSRSRVEQKDGFYAKRISVSEQQSAYMLRALFRRLRKQVNALAPKIDSSIVNSYMEHDNNYTAADLARKEQFVKETLTELRPNSVLDIGCNNGHFSNMAASVGARVVGLDRSPEYVDGVWAQASANGRSVLPLHLNLARPTPATGWRNSECSSFLDRAAAHFDMVMMLAVIHHLLVTERVPLREIIGLVAELTSRYVILEFVSAQDPMFKRLARGRDELHRDFTQERFEAECRSFFDIRKVCRYESPTRCLYLLERR